MNSIIQLLWTFLVSILDYKTLVISVRPRVITVTACCSNHLRKSLKALQQGDESSPGNQFGETLAGWAEYTLEAFPSFKSLIWRAVMMGLILADQLNCLFELNSG